MNKELKKLNAKLPCREKVLNELYNLIGNSSEYYPNAIYLFGHTGTGKTTIIKKFLRKFSQKFIIINCIECYTNRILFENILRTFKPEQENDKFKCDNFESFINELCVLDSNISYIICLDNAERTRDMDLNILSGFLRLQELTGLNICTILLSQLTFEKFYPKAGLSEIINIYLPQYMKQDIQKILLNDFEKVKIFVCSKLIDKSKDEDEYNEKSNHLNNFNLDFYENYLSTFLAVFYIACRDLPELRMVSRDCFQTYCEPVLNGEIDQNDVAKLWRYISMPLKIALSRIYMRVDNLLEMPTAANKFDNSQSIQKLARSMELPYYAKFLLIAAFLASHNAAKDDKRLFLKNSGKQRKRMQTVNAQAKVQDKMSTSLGPKSFSIDRLLAIFYAILEEKVGLTCNLLSQISSLTQLKLLTFASGENNIMEGSAKLQCTVGLDFIIHVGKGVDFNVRQYLTDFM